jgi:transcriptional repressor NrdR
VGDVTRRRRECEKCARRFTTYERVEEILPFVVKKDGRREPFDRVKLLGGIRRACQKRDVPLATLEGLVDTIERDLMDSGEKEVLATTIGEKVMPLLRAQDEIAYVRFASVYKSFRDLDEFRAELETVAATRQGPSVEATRQGSSSSGRDQEKPSSRPGISAVRGVAISESPRQGSSIEGASVAKDQPQ